MNKQQFNSLTIEEQVKTFNQLYKEHNSIRNVCSLLEIGKTTIRDRFKRHSYTFNGSEYTREVNIPLGEKKPPIEPVSEYKPNMIELEQAITRIVDEKISKLLEVKKFKTIELSSRCEGDVKYRSFGIYKNVLVEFLEFCENKRFSQIELMSQSLIDLMDKYK